MMILLIITLIFFNFWARVKFKKGINPISLFTFIFFMHNLSFYILYFYKFPVSLVPNFISYNSIDEVFKINYFSYSSICLVFLILCKKDYFKEFFLNFKMKNKLSKIYNFLVITSFIYFIINFQNQYGANQAATSSLTFNPFKRLIDIRYYLAVFLMINSNSKNTIKFVLVELFISLISGGRKSLVIVFLSYLLTKDLRINLKQTLRFSLFITPLIYMLLFINITRGLDSELSFLEKYQITNNFIAKYSGQVVSNFIVSSNSEGVQNWTYQLIKSNSMDLSYGKSYIQAFVNLIVLRLFQGSISDWQAAYKFKYIAYPNTNNHGWDYSFSAEAIMNWGDYAFISYVLLSIFIVNLYNKQDKSMTYKTLYYSVFPFLMIFFRTDSTSLFRSFSYMFFISIVVTYYLNKKNKKWV